MNNSDSTALSFPTGPFDRELDTAFAKLVQKIGWLDMLARMREDIDCMSMDVNEASRAAAECMVLWEMKYNIDEEPDESVLVIPAAFEYVYLNEHPRIMTFAKMPKTAIKDLLSGNACDEQMKRVLTSKKARKHLKNFFFILAESRYAGMQNQLRFFSADD